MSISESALLVCREEVIKKMSKNNLRYFNHFCSILSLLNAEDKIDPIKVDWSFKDFGKFDRPSLQRGYQVYTEVFFMPFNEFIKL